LSNNSGTGPNARREGKKGTGQDSSEREGKGEQRGTPSRRTLLNLSSKSQEPSFLFRRKDLPPERDKKNGDRKEKKKKRVGVYLL